MKSMPNKIKLKLKQLQSYTQKAKVLENEVCNMIEEYGVDIDYLNANKNDGLPVTEALAYIVNAEGNVDENISEIEDVFLQHINKLS